MDAKLKRLRAEQRQLRQRGDEASRQRIHAVTEQIRRLAEEEDRLRSELGSEGKAATA